MRDAIAATFAELHAESEFEADADSHVPVL